MSYSSTPVHRDAADDAPATLPDREAACDRAVTAAFGARSHAAGSCRKAATTIAAIATAVDALDTVEDDGTLQTPTAPRGADDAWADWRGCICGGGAYGEMCPVPLTVRGTQTCVPRTVNGTGQMVACDGGCDNWFHFECVGLASAPRGEYICDACGAGFGFRRAYDDEDDDDNRAIACLHENPKKPGSACNLRYEAYKSATTVAEFLAKGGTPADLTHDVGKGFVWYLDADDSQEDGRRPRGNQPPKSTPRKRIASGINTLEYTSQVWKVLSAARRKRRRLGLPRGHREPPETCCCAARARARRRNTHPKK